jgi:hypothetical protein
MKRLGGERGTLARKPVYECLRTLSSKLQATLP